MADVVTNLPADFAEVSADLAEGDELLKAAELSAVSLFRSLRKTPSFEKFPGTVVLRKCQPGRVMCTQGQAGATAFYILTPDDLDAIRRVRTDQAQRESDTTTFEPSVVAHAQLFVDLAPKQRRGTLRRLLDRLTFGRTRPDDTEFIPIDGPADLDAKTMRAPLQEGDVFGEMSCMNRAPRSATVIVDRPCYMLEMLKNIFDMLQRDAEYQKRMDQVYRQRVLETHIRKLSIFRDLTDAEYGRLKENITLENHPSGSVIFDEHNPSDCFYVIRSGLVKVVKGLTVTFAPDDIPQTLLADLEKEAAALSQSQLGAAVLAAAAPTFSESLQKADPEPARGALNHFVQHARIAERLGKTLADAVDAAGLTEYADEFAACPQKTREWSDVDHRVFNRLVLERVFTALPPRVLRAGRRRVLAYLGRGDFIGEMGVMTNAPRSATCVAYDHPDCDQKIAGGPGTVPSRVELVRIDRDVLLELAEKSPALNQRIRDEIDKRRASTAAITEQSASVPVVNQSPEFEGLGLIQGQKLMLIDLDRCTRCGECVNACVDSHADGHTRLYLDGPRFEQYLVPLSCRKCLDPVCMIGCPVGAIVRGDENEILIRDWCIGCSRCADQCPYGSIQMNPIESSAATESIHHLAEGAQSSVKAVSARAVVCDMCTSTVRGEPSCVYACPHEAALRVNAHDYFIAADSL